MHFVRDQERKEEHWLKGTLSQKDDIISHGIILKMELFKRGLSTIGINDVVA